MARRLNKTATIIISIIVVIIVTAVVTIICLEGNSYTSRGKAYNLVQIDLSNRASFVEGSQYDYLYENIVIDDDSDYMAHPDSILINDKLVTMYVNGHGKGPILTKVSLDGGLTYSDRLQNTPSSWEHSEETPTLFKLEFKNGEVRYIMVSANPKWSGYTSGDGFNVSISQTSNYDDFSTWSEFQKFYGKNDPVKYVDCIVAMSSLVHLKENGEFVDKWMGIFHDHDFKNYKTILSFDEEGNMVWSTPTEYFKGLKGDYFDIAKKTNMCEVLMFRNDNNTGDILCLITRSNTKKCNSLISFSYDEGETWSEPKEIFSALNGERHKLVYTNDGRIAITFRSIEREEEGVKKYAEPFRKFYSQGWIMWVGTWDDLMNYYCGFSDSEGQYRIKLAHTYLAKQTAPQISANADTGYAGNVVLSDGTIVTTSYGTFSPLELNSEGDYKTYIVSKRIKLTDVDEIYNLYLQNS